MIQYVELNHCCSTRSRFSSINFIVTTCPLGTEQYEILYFTLFYIIQYLKDKLL